MSPDPDARRRARRSAGEDEADAEPEAAGKREGSEEEAAGPERPEAGAGGFLPELLRRGLTLGFTGVFLTEEAVRRALGDSVPRDLMEFILEQSERTRRDFVERVSREFGRTLRGLDPAELARRLLEGRTVEVTARIRLVREEPEPGDEAPREGDASDGAPHARERRGARVRVDTEEGG